MLLYVIKQVISDKGTVDLPQVAAYSIFIRLHSLRNLLPCPTEWYLEGKFPGTFSVNPTFHEYDFLNSGSSWCRHEYGKVSQGVAGSEEGAEYRVKGTPGIQQD